MSHASDLVNEPGLGPSSRKQHYPSPPMSPRKRRQLQRSSEETQGEMSLGQYLERLDIYRKTAPPMAPLPSWFNQFTAPHPMLQREAEITETARQFMRDRNVQYSRISLGHRQGVPTCSILSNMDITESWGPACLDVYGEFQKRNGLEELHIEIINYEKAHSMREFLIPTDSTGDKIVGSWDRARTDVMKVVRNRLEEPVARWHTVCVFMCGNRPEKVNPTVVITTDLDAFADWASISLEISSALIRHDVHDFNVEFSIGKVTPSKRVEVQEKLSPGDSIGIQGDMAFSGSIGGFLKLKVGTPPQARACAMTCHHVVRPEPRDSSESVDPLKLQPRNTSNPRATKTVSPSRGDYNDSMAWASERLKEEASNVTALEKSKAKQGGFLVPKDAYTLEESRRLQNLWDGVVRRLKNRESTLGISIANSGFRVNQDGRKMDWALVEVNPDDFQPNRTWHRDLNPNLSGPQHCPRGEWAKGGELVDGVDNLAGGDWVCMKGRTSGVTTGVVHRISMEIADWGRENFVSRELVIFHTDSDNNQRLIFSQPGDSGSWILNARGKLVAMQIAHRDRKVDIQDLTIATPIRDVFRDVEDCTEGKLSLSYF